MGFSVLDLTPSVLGFHSHDLMQTRATALCPKVGQVREQQDGGDPVTLFLHVPGLIGIHNKKKREKLRLP